MSSEALQHATGPGMHEVIMAINIGVVIAIVIVAGRKGILEGLKTRSKDIADKLFKAKNELEKAKAEIEKSRLEVAALAQTKAKLLKEVEEEGRRLSAALIEEAQQSAERIISDAQLTAANEVSIASKNLQQTLVKKAADEALALVAKSEGSASGLRSQIHEKLIERFIAETAHQGVANGR